MSGHSTHAALPARTIQIMLVASALVGWALFAGLWTPRGPVTTAQALIAMVVSVLLGVLAGHALRSRWAMLLAPTVFVVVFELARLGTAGPTVDGPHASAYGLLALAVGRGLHGLIGLAPMVIGACWGAAAARRVSRSVHQVGRRDRAGRRARGLVLAVTTLALLAFAAAVARPAGTSRIVDAKGQELAGSVAQLTRVDVFDHQLAMMIRGRSTTNPVLLFLAGGPGGTELGAMRHHGQALEDDFTVVTLDQRGAGRSYDQLEPASTLTLPNAVSDTIAVTNYLRARFAQDRIYVLGQSWGTILAVLAAQQHPELFHAVIGSGQMVSPRETDRISYRDTVTWARTTGRTDLVATLTASGPPPYSSILDYEPALSHEQDVYPYDHSGNAEGVGQMGEGLSVGEYSLLDQAHAFAGFLDTFAFLYPQLQAIDFRTDVPRLEVPVFLFQGRHEAPGRARLAEQWLAGLEAPAKQVTIADTSGHRALWEQPREFQRFMLETVLAGGSGP